MSEMNNNLDVNFNGQGINENQLFQNQNNNYGQYKDSNVNQQFNNIQEPFINNMNIQINPNEISLPVSSQNNIDDGANQKLSIPTPFNNEENNQNIISSSNHLSMNTCVS